MSGQELRSTGLRGTRRETFVEIIVFEVRTLYTWRYQKYFIAEGAQGRSVIGRSHDEWLKSRSGVRPRTPQSKLKATQTPDRLPDQRVRTIWASLLVEVPFVLFALVYLLLRRLVQWIIGSPNELLRPKSRSWSFVTR